LRERELAKAQETGLAYVTIRKGEEMRGIYRHSMVLNSGRFAVIERADDFALVPWRPVLERAKG
jgi:hypothetical protein